MNITLLATGALPTTGVDLVKKVVFGQSALSLAVVCVNLRRINLGRTNSRRIKWNPILHRL